MGMVINHNIPALMSFNAVSATMGNLQKSIQKLSSGLRINSAADDAAGLAISEKMRAQVRGLDRAAANSQDGISMIQTAEGALNETHSILQRMRELSVQSANDTLTQQDRGYIQLEVDQLREEITRIGNVTQFNKKKLLNGDAAVLWSSNNLKTKAIVNGGLRQIDQFGQKEALEGNYNIKIKAEPGKGEVQKTDIFRIKHDVDASLPMSDPAMKSGYVTVAGTPAMPKRWEAVATGNSFGSQPVAAVAGFLEDATKPITVEVAPNLHGETIKKGTVDSSGNYATADTKVNFSVSGDVKHNALIKASFKKSTGEMTITGTRIEKDGTSTNFSHTETFASGAIAGATKIWDSSLSGGPDIGTITFKLTDTLANAADGDIYFNLAADIDPANDAIVKISGDNVFKGKAQHNAKAMDGTYLVLKKSPNTNKALSLQGLFSGPDTAAPTTGASLTVMQPNALSGTDKLVISFKAKTDATGAEQPINQIAMPSAPAGAYAIAGNVTDSAVEGSAVQIGAQASNSVLSFKAGTGAGNLGDTSNATNAILKFTVQSIEPNGKISLTYTGNTIKSDGTLGSETGKLEGMITDDMKLTVGGNPLNVNFNAGVAKNLKKGEEFVYNITAHLAASTAGDTSGSNTTFNIAGDKLLGTHQFNIAGNKMTPGVSLNGFSLAYKKGDSLNLTDPFSIKMANPAAIGTDNEQKVLNKILKNGTWAQYNMDPKPITGTIGEVANNGTKLVDLEKFWDAQGRFMLTDPQTLTITQGDGKQAKVTLYANDTIETMGKKLNEAIADTLGQGQYVDAAGKDKFVNFVEEKTKTPTLEGTEGTFVIRSVAPGASGRINFSGDEDVIKALSLNTLVKAKESNYTVNITDAHTGSVIVKDAQTTGNKLIGVLNPNIDVEFDAMAGITAKWNDIDKAFETTSTDYDTVLHLADNTTVFQIGANEGEDMGINIGDMRAHSLGLNSVLVTDRESAARSITIIDNAIDKVSTQRARLGAYQNRLEHTISNLTVAGENLTAAESRIRDTDMAKEMMNFTKLNIMLQAGNAMLAQANQLPQGVLSLIR